MKTGTFVTTTTDDMLAEWDRVYLKKLDVKFNVFKVGDLVEIGYKKVHGAELIIDLQK